MIVVMPLADIWHLGGVSLSSIVLVLSRLLAICAADAQVKESMLPLLRSAAAMALLSLGCRMWWTP